MISVDEHLNAILARITPPDPVTLPVSRVLGLVTAADVYAQMDLPRFDNSAMDGYAVRREDLAGASRTSPVRLVVSGDVPAGPGLPREHVAGQAWRIMTGAPMPEGADAIIRVEDTDGHAHEVICYAQPEEAEHLRRAGEDVRAGDLVVRRDTRIRPQHIAAMVAAGVTELEVFGRPRVATLSSGDELVPPGQPLGPGQIVDSNGPMLQALVQEAGAHVVHVGSLPDDVDEVNRIIDAVVDRADLVITTGGVSKGAYDAVKEALSGRGSMTFTEVAMAPGKPQGFGVVGRRSVPVFTLPGNPVSALVSFEVFVRPALEKASGRLGSVHAATGFATRSWTTASDRQTYSRVVITRDSSGSYAVTPVDGQGSHMLVGLSRADALAVIPADVDEVKAGAEVDLILFATRRELDGQLADRDRMAAEDPFAEAGPVR